MNAIQFIKDHGVEKAREVVEGAPETATHFIEALGGHYAKEGMLKMKPQWLWFNSINKEWYYDFAAKDHIHLPDLKRLVESVDLVKDYANRESGKWFFIADYCKKNKISPFLSSNYEAATNLFEQAIADYEAIYSEQVK
ncbi:hypothetical protein SB581_12150 [Acinetobacter baumannii]|nr:hypothetical protein SB581_12150 [Acinetobacter baumannii]